jgi:hypothetical protein
VFFHLLSLIVEDLFADSILCACCYSTAISIHDSVYNTDFASFVVPFTAKTPDAQATEIEEHVVCICPTLK